MNDKTLEYLAACKKHFNTDIKNGWFGRSPDELRKNKNFIGNIWMSNHNNNKDYFDILYGDIDSSFDGKTCLDYGCGFGGNIENLSGICKWKKLIGYELTKELVDYAEKYLSQISNVEIFETNGYELKETPSSSVDFVTSIVVLQHIAFHQIKYEIFKEFFRVLQKGGVASFQMDMSSKNSYDYRRTLINDGDLNTRMNCVISDPQEVVEDLDKIGFADISYFIRTNPATMQQNGWIYFKAIK